MEVYHNHQTQLTLFSGEDLNINPTEDLNGACDFFFSRKPNAFLLEALIVSLTEAKDEDMDYGTAQCTAQMIGAQRFSTASEQDIPVIWGCATTAGEWRFIKLEGQKLYINNASFYVDKLDVLLGAFHWIFKQVA